jgi:hypothetical protein
MKSRLWIAALSTVIRYGSSHSDDRWYRVCGAVRRCAAHGSDASRHRQAGYDPQRPYYESWGAALESMVVDLELTTPAELDAAAPTERVPL